MRGVRRFHFAVIAFVALVSLPSCTRRCTPDHCGSGQVCGLDGRCSPEPSVGGEGDWSDPSEELVATEPSVRRVSLHARHWGSSGASSSVELGGPTGQTLYLAFELPAGASEAVLELHPTSLGAAQGIEVRAVAPFEEIVPGRLPGASGPSIVRDMVVADVMRFDVSELIDGGRLFLAVEGRGQSPWSVATPAASAAELRPRLWVSSQTI